MAKSGADLLSLTLSTGDRHIRSTRVDMAIHLRRQNPELPFFSVILPAHNKAQDLGKSLASLFSQSDPDWEVIVVDRGSTDETRQVLESLCTKDKRIRVINQSNGDMVLALNRGFAEARGEWICWLDPDRSFDPLKLEIYRKSIEKHSRCRFFCNHFFALDDRNGEILDYPLRLSMYEQEWQLLEMLACPFIDRHSVCLHREVFSKVGWFNKELQDGYDYDLWLRLLALYPATFIPERTCTTRCHPGHDVRGFPEAGFFDSAKAAICFLNEHPFAAMVPWTDLRNPRKAYEAVDKTLQVAGNPGAFLYALGAHPALLWRLIEWAWSDQASVAAERIQGMIRHRLKRLANRYKGSSYGFYCRILAAVCRLPERKCEYQSISPRSVAELNYFVLRSQNDAKAESLLRYLNRFERQLSVIDSPDAEKGREIVLICQEGQTIPYDPPYGTLKATLSLAHYLLQKGHLVLLVGLSDQAMGLFDGVPFLGAGDEESLKQVVKLLGPKDTVIGISRGDMLYMGWAERILIYHHGPHPVQRVSVASLNKAAAPIVCVSEYSRKEQNGFGLRSDLLHVIPNGFDHTLFCGTNAHERNPRSLIYVGHIVEYKGFDIALRAFETVRKEFPEAIFSAYGQAISWRQCLHHQFEKDWLDAEGFPVWSTIERAVPGFRYFGEASSKELAEAFQRHSLLVLPARIGETFGIVSVEAQACGCIPVIPRKGAFPETLLEGNTGYLYDVNTSEHLAGFVIDLWRGGLPTEEQRAAAHLWVQSTFSWARSHAAFVEIMDSTPPRHGGIRVLPIHALRLWEYGKSAVLRPLLRRVRRCWK